MRVNSKYLFYEGLPTARDKSWIMAANGYPIDVAGAAGPAPSQGMNLDFQYPSIPQHTNTVNNPNNIIDYVLAGAGIADGLIPDGRVHRNYPTTPLPVYNPYPSGTGSQAIYDYGGDIDEAKGGHWIQGAVNPKHKGYCTPITKSTCTGHRKALAMTFKKHHGFHEDGGDIDAKTGIHIKPSKVGTLHDAVGVSRDKKIPASKLKINKNDSPALKKKKQFAINAKKWHHADGGVIHDPGNPFYYGSADDGDVLEQFLPRFTGINPATDSYNDGGYVLEQFFPRFTGINPATDSYAHGGTVSPDKAKEILRDGTAQGHKLTPKQKRYFGFIAGGGHPTAPDGTYIPNIPNSIQNQWSGFSDDKSKTNFADMISYNLAGNPAHDQQGAFLKTATSMYGVPQGRKIYNDILAYNQRPEVQRYSPQQRIQNYYDINSQDPEIQAIKSQYRNFAKGPNVLYNTSPDVNIQAQQRGIASRRYGGYMENGGYMEGSTHDMSEEQIASLLKQGYKIEYL